MSHVEAYAQYRPHVGDMITYKGEQVGKVTRVEDSLCFRTYPNGEVLPFIWVFKDGLNALHSWPTKGDGKRAFCPGGHVC